MANPNVRVSRTTSESLTPAESNIDIRPIMHGEGAIIFRNNGKDELIFPIEEDEGEQIEVLEDSPRYKLLLCATFLSDPGLVTIVAGRIKPSVS